MSPRAAHDTTARIQDLEAREYEHVIQSYARLPVEFVRAKGSSLWDEQGNKYLDFLCGISVTNIGHCHPRVVAAVRKQVGRLMHVSNLFYTEPAVLLAQRLAESSLKGRVFFCNSGAEATEAAIKLARKARMGGEIVTVRGAFHGRSYGALSATHEESKQAPFAPLVPGFRAVDPTPGALKQAVGPKTAAVLLEPIQGESGVHVLSNELLHAARAACDEHNAALIFDEVQCGMGRTGTLWAYEQVGVEPDALTTAKALGGGLPIGALVTAPILADVLETGDHGSTFAGGPVACAAALEALEITRDPHLLARVTEAGHRLLDGLEHLPHVTSVRGRGLMLACELEISAPEVVHRALLEQRLVVNATGPTTLRLLPPLIVTDAEIDEAVGRLERALEG